MSEAPVNTGAGEAVNWFWLDVYTTEQVERLPQRIAIDYCTIIIGEPLVVYVYSV